MKKILLSIVLAILVSCTSMTSFATTDISIDVRSTDGNGISVSGSIDVPKGNRELLLRFLDQSGNEKYVASCKTVYSNGEVTFAFDTFIVDMNYLTSGEYTVIISGPDLTEPQSVLYTYRSPAERLEALKTLETASESNEVGAIVEALESCANILELDAGFKDVVNKDEENKNNDGTKALEARLREDVEYDLDGAEDEYGNIDTAVLDVHISAIKEALEDGIAAGLFVSANSRADVSKWMDNYYDKFNFADGHDRDNDDAETEEERVDLAKNADEGTETFYFNKVRNSENFVNRIIKYEGTPKREDIKKFIYESSLLAGIYSETDTEVEKILLNFTSYFTELDVSGYNSLSNMKKGDVISSVGGKSYETCSDVKKAFNNAVNPTDDDIAESNGKSGPKSNGIASIITLPIVNDAETSAKDIFSDMVGVEWAKEAVEYLYKLEIINGYPDGSFAPNDEVTRAEFIKMVTKAIGVDLVVGESPFVDVNNDDWFFSSVISAAKSGLIMGDENGNFNPNEPITRQDMVAILYRVLDVDEGGDMKFVDSDIISGYAKDAVGYFVSKGIVNGVDDGIFAPLDNATRAQTAVILYRLIMM